MSLIALNKPYGVLCQFTDSDGRPTLADYLDVPDVYPVGRLDYDSEGLVLLTADGRLKSRLSHPRHRVPKTYWVQVEGWPRADALEALRRGVTIQGRRTRPAEVAAMDPPDDLWPRDPPIRFRKNVPDSWLSLTITEGRNRQVRRMTAAVGHPTLRLVRVRVGRHGLDGLRPGEWRRVVPGRGRQSR